MEKEPSLEPDFRSSFCTLSWSDTVRREVSLEMHTFRGSNFTVDLLSQSFSTSVVEVVTPLESRSDAAERLPWSPWMTDVVVVVPEVFSNSTLRASRSTWMPFCDSFFC